MPIVTGFCAFFRANRSFCSFKVEYPIKTNTINNTMSQIQKKLYIPTYCMAFDRVNEVNNITKPLFDRHPIDFFDYARIFFDGSWIFFTTYTGISQYLFDSGFVFLPYVNLKKTQSFHLLSSIEKFKPYMASIKENFRIDNLFAYADKHEHYIDVFWFGSDEKNDGMVDFYLNNMDIIKNYSHYFIEEASDLIKTAEKKRIIIPTVLKDDYNDAFQRIKNLSQQAAKFDVAGNEVLITPREMDCLRFLKKGFTAKMIAAQLKLSSRTVESHIEKIKRKLNCHSRAQIMTLLDLHDNHFSKLCHP